MQLHLAENEKHTCKPSKATLLLNMQICDILLSWLLIKLPNRAKRHFCVRDE